MMKLPLSSEIDILRELFNEIKDEINISSSIIDSNNFNVSIMPGGSSNINYKIEIKSKSNKIFFVKHQSIPPVSRFYADNLEREFDTASYFNKHNLAPKPLYIDKTKKYLISEFIPGKNLQTSNFDMTSILIAIGKVINRCKNAPIHLLKRLKTGTRLCPKNFFFDVILPTNHKFTTQILEEGSSKLYQFLEDITGYLHNNIRYEPESDCTINWETYQKNRDKYPWGLIHNDFSFRNIIYSVDNKFQFVDWEFADVGDIAYDLAYLMSENLLLEPQIISILNYAGFKSENSKQILRNVRIFRPMLELSNAFWTLNHITLLMKNQNKKISLRPPHTIGQNLEYVRWKLSKLSRLTNSGYSNQREIFQEIQQALKMFEVQLILAK